MARDSVMFPIPDAANVRLMDRSQHNKGCFKKPMAEDAKIKHGPAEQDRSFKVFRGRDDIFNAEGNPGRRQPGPDRRDTVRMIARGSPLGRASGISLAWRTGPDEIKPAQLECHRIRLDELEGIPFLRPDIDADNFRIRPCAAETHRRPPSSAE